MKPVRILTIAGSDSGGGAGIQADLKTITVLGGFGMSVITALTAQNTLGVHGIHDVPPAFVAAQFDAVATDIGIDAAKTGMLATSEVIRVVAGKIRQYGIENLVVLHNLCGRVFFGFSVRFECLFRRLHTGAEMRCVQSKPLLDLLANLLGAVSRVDLRDQRPPGDL